MTRRASVRFRNHSIFKHSPRSLPLKLSRCAVLPGLSWIDQRRFNALVHDPFQQCPRYKFGPVVRAKISRRAASANHAGQHLNNPARADRAAYVNSQAFPRVFVDQRQTLDLLAVGACVEDKIIRPEGWHEMASRVGAGWLPHANEAVCEALAAQQVPTTVAP